MADREEVLRRLTLGDEAFLGSLISSRRTATPGKTLCHDAVALVRLGALAVTDGSDLTWQKTVEAALDAGLTTDEVVDALVVLAPTIGATRTFAVAPKVAMAIGYDVGAALEAPG
jgi:alkylhydroperoxidase/carboxymuconolactone decarboxylase family protein YurZ